MLNIYNHPSKTAYYRDLRAQLFVHPDVLREFGDNVVINHSVNHEHVGKTTLAAIKIEALDEIMAADPIAELQEALHAVLNDPMNFEVMFNARQALHRTKRFGPDYR